MLIIALLIGSILVPLAAQVEQRKISETEKALSEIREALLGFALSNGYLPCPDKTIAAGAGTMHDGAEDVSGTSCVATEGNLPWVTLGVPATDSWGNRYRYRVAPAFAQRGPPVLAITTVSTLEVCVTNSCGSRLTTSGDGPPAVVMSHGRNGLGAFSSITNLQNPLPPAGSDERENTDGDTRFVSRVQTDAGTTAGEFDDIVVWMPRGVLLNRMVAAGKLP